MGALIRSARLAPARTRLSKAIAECARVAAGPGEPRLEGAAWPASEDPAALRALIEQDVREELVEQGRAALDAELKKGHAQGYAAGLAAAEAAATQQRAEALGELRAQAELSLAALGQAHLGALSRLEASVGDVAFASVCQIAGRHAISQDFVLGVVEEVVAGLRVGVMVRARLHPRDLETLRALLNDPAPADLALRMKALSLDLIADESLALGGCVIETASGEYDGGLEVQLRRLHEVLCATTDTVDAPRRR